MILKNIKIKKQDLTFTWYFFDKKKKRKRRTIKAIEPKLIFKSRFQIHKNAKTKDFFLNW